MFSFHKPKIYRSAAGCCICRAKSSSSRFTDSRKYEDNFNYCFKLEEIRTGDICNACVLLVKRWKKLPKGSQRNWHHVVDARAGYGSRPMSKINKVKKLIRTNSNNNSVNQNGVNIYKTRNKNNNNNFSSSDSENNHHNLNQRKDDLESEIKKCMRIEDDETISISSSSSSTDDVVIESELFDTIGKRKHSNSGESDCTKSERVKRFETENSLFIGRRTIMKRNIKVLPTIKGENKRYLFDPAIWEKESTCCGNVHIGPFNIIAIDPNHFKSCGTTSKEENGISPNDDTQVNVEEKTHTSPVQQTFNCEREHWKDMFRDVLGNDYKTSPYKFMQPLKS